MNSEFDKRCRKLITSTFHRVIWNTSRVLPIIFLLTSTVVDGKRESIRDPWPETSYLETSSVSYDVFTPYIKSTLDRKYITDVPSTFRFSGADSQFVKMPAWKPRAPMGLPSSDVFSFQFRTPSANAILMYLDDGGPRDYMELSIHETSLRLRFKFGNALSVKVTVGDKLNGRKWHSVKMEVKFPSVILTVDGTRAVGTAEGDEASPINPGSFTYLGGIPELYKLQDLSLPSVYFEKEFRGAIRRFAINGKYQKAQEILRVGEEQTTDQCYEEQNPCQNNGSCYVFNKLPVCDCTGIPFTGTYCEEQTDNEAAATFYGSQWFSYDMKDKTISSFRDSITLSFKTKQSNGLILHTGKSADYVNLVMKNGAIILVVNLGSGEYEVILKPIDGKFNDNKWHSIRVIRELERVNLTVDNAHTTSRFTQNDFTQLTLDDVFYVGGSPSTIDLPGSKVTNNFIGCLKEVQYKNEDSVLQLSRMANSRDPQIRVEGIIDYTCTDVDVFGPVTFTTPESYLKIRPWRNTSGGVISLDFRTTEKYGLLLYGAADDAVDFVAIELYDGYLYLKINMGSVTSKMQITSQRLNDGDWHQLIFSRIGRRLRFSVDSQEVQIDAKGSASQLDISSFLSLGGTDFDALAASSKIPKELWTASLKYGFVGCIRDVFLDSTGVDIQALAKEQGRNAVDVAPQCENFGKSLCSSSPCKHGGRCQEGWNRFLCDCSATPFSGPTCELVVSTAGFNGSQVMTFPMSGTQRTQAEEINFRFKTPISSGVLMSTISKTTGDRLTVEIIQSGQIKLTVNIDCLPKNCTAPRQGPESIFQGNNLNDNSWHTVKISRYGKRITLLVDGKIRGSDLSGGHRELQFDFIYLGFVPANASMRLRQTLPSYVGQIQNLLFNKNPLIDRCFKRDVNCKFTGTWGDRKIISNPITFKEKDSFVSTTKLNAYRSMTLYFNLRTTVMDGLILYNAGKGKDFIAVELVNGFIHYVYNFGNRAKTISTPDQGKINDNKWHEVRIVRDETNTHTLTVDGMTVTHQGMDERKYLDLDLEDALYIGGVREDIQYNNLPNEVASWMGFQGCLATIDLNGRSPDLLGDDLSQLAGTVTRGCSGPSESCNSSSCKNNGVCMQEWDGFTCDCSMTTHVGKFCDNPGTAFQFGATTGEGLILYNWPSSSFPSSRMDELALGFATRKQNCVLTRISSSLGNIRDFMQLEIKNGKLTLTFNIGSKDVVLTEPQGVTNGQHHTVQVYRKWMNATMRVNNWPERSVAPSGNARNRYARAVPAIPPAVRPTVDEWLRRKAERNTVFNSQSTIQIGGLLVDSSTYPPFSMEGVSRTKRAETLIDKPFKGQMTGFFFNGVRVFRLAAYKSERITFVGDVQLIGKPSADAPPPPGFPPSTPPSVSFPTTTMATTTTFSTSSTRGSRATPVAGEEECDGEELCNGASDIPKTKPPMRPPTLPPPMRKTSTQSKFANANYTFANSRNSVRSTSYGRNQNNSLVEKPDGIIRTPENGVPDTEQALLGGMLTGTTVMIAGIVGAAVICIVAILFAMYRYKHREENSYRVDERTRNMNGRGMVGKPIANGKSDSLTRHNGNSTIHGQTLSSKECDKEYYV